MAAPERPSNPLVVRTRTDSGRRWETEFHIKPADSQPSRLELQSRGSNPNPEKGGILEKYDVFVASTPEGVSAAARLIRALVDHWPIHWIRDGENEIRPQTDFTPVGLQINELNGVKQAISHRVQQQSE